MQVQLVIVARNKVFIEMWNSASYSSMRWGVTTKYWVGLDPSQANESEDQTIGVYMESDIS